MAGLPDYLMMGFGIAGLYIGVKYGPQIITNLKQNQANPQSQNQAQQTPSSPTSQTPASQGDNLDVTPPVVVGHRPRHQNDTGTYRPPAPAPPLSLHDQSLNIQPPNAGAIHPSNGPHIAPTPTTVHKRRHTTLPEHHPGPCPDGSYPDKDNNCKPIPTYLQANLGYFDSYNIPVDGPQWRKTIPNYQFVASQGMVKQGRVRRALAVSNSNFMPGGFVLSEASVRRGVNNVYSAGT